MRRAQIVFSTLLSRNLLPSSSATAAAERTLLRTVLYSTAATSPRSQWRSSPSPAASVPSKSVSVGLAGALSFSLTLVTAAEAKEPLSPDLLPKDVVLYQYEACPFCNKVKAFLDYYDIPYKIVEVNPLSKKEIKWSDYKKVPILVVDGEQLVDSSDIINKLSHRLHPDNSAVDEEEAKWRRWVDEHLVHVLSPNIYRTTSEALESFDYIAKHGDVYSFPISENILEIKDGSIKNPLDLCFAPPYWSCNSADGNFSTTERFTAKYAGAAIMYIISKKLKKKYNITDERAALYEAAETWTKALDGRDFLGGSKPNLADLAVFGVLRPIRYLKAGRDMVENTQIGEWYQRMETAVGEPAGTKA
ncbi:prostaglandin E synthase 2 [Cocos nucifera]|uniref:Prostaglandin E synthase 2 n=1 Tax=Cocos nucifera TaxID=13894 RepID=A0A8K0IE52_COCNU|nr:prostaglandin E synthase 2 [Cocos nucifera]